MAVQGKTNVCSRCFASVRETDQVCPECGAPLKSDGSVQAVDSAMHVELAQANLYRVRGEIDAAEKQCLSILKRFPNEPEAHSLLGELSVDKGDLPRAIEWYELAMDLNPNSTKDRDRLLELKHREHSTETAQIEEQLSLAPKPNSGLWVGIGIFLVAMIILGGYAVLHGSSSTQAVVQHGAVVAPKEGSDAIVGKPILETPSKTVSNPVPSSVSTANVAESSSQMPLSVDDRALMQLLQQRSTAGPNITTVEQDPRDKALTLTYQVQNAEDARKTGATLARDALIQSPDSLIVTVRGLSGDRLVFVADGSRPRLTTIEAQNPQGIQTGNDNWIGSFLQREWSVIGNSTAAADNSAGMVPPTGLETGKSSPPTTTGLSTP